MHEQDLTPSRDLNRRSLIKRAAVTGAATAWATPTIQSLATPAFAAGSPPGACNSCITGGGNDIGGGTLTIDGASVPIESITVGLGQICCVPRSDPSNAQPQLQVTFHPVQPKHGPKIGDYSYHFDTLLSITCSKNQFTPDPPPDTKNCSNVFDGTATDDEGHTLVFHFEDNGGTGNGESGDLDVVGITVSGNGVSGSGYGNLTKGNLQVHAGLGPMEHDCSGC